MKAEPTSSSLPSQDSPMSLRRRALARFLALPALLAGRRAAAAPAAAPLADAYSREIRKSEPQRLPAVYHH